MDIKRLAHLAGTSPASVSLVLNGKWQKKVRPDLAEKIEKLVHKYGFIRNVAGKALAMKRHFKIAVCIEGSMDKYPIIGSFSFHQLLTIVASRLYKNNYAMDIVQLDSQSAKMPDSWANIQSSHDGVIFVGTSAKFFCGRNRNKISMPAVVVDADIRNKYFSYMYTDMSESSEMAVKFLIGHGHRHIAIIRGEMSDARFAAKLKGYRRALRTAGRSFDARLVKTDMITGSYENSYTAASDMMRLPDQPTAFFCTDNTCALGVMRLLLEKNFRLPEDIEIIGFGDEAIANLSTPLLSFVRRPIEEMASAAVEHLLAQIDSQNKIVPTDRKFNEELVLRGTTKCI